MKADKKESPVTRNAFKVRRFVRNRFVRHRLDVAAPESLSDVGDPRVFRPSPDKDDGGIFGCWMLDDAGLPAYEYVLDQYKDPRAAYPNTEGLDRRDHWHQIGNDRITGLASNDGTVQVYLGDRGGVLLNRFEEGEKTGCLGIMWTMIKIIISAPLRWLQTRRLDDEPKKHRSPDTRTQLKTAIGSREAHKQDASSHAYAGGFGYVNDGAEAWATGYRYRPHDSETRRVFGMGYFETVIDYHGLRVTRKVYAPTGDVPALLVDVTLEKTDGAADVSYYEYWDVNIHQMKLQWARTGAFAPMGDAERRGLNRFFIPSIRCDQDSKVLRFHQEFTPSSYQPEQPEPDETDPVDWYPADVFLADLSGTPDAYYTDKEKFFGAGSVYQPEAVRSRRDGDAETASADALMPYCMVLRRDVHLEAGQTVKLRFAYGTVRRAENDGEMPDDWKEQFGKYSTGDPLADTLADWKKRLAYFTIGSSPALQREMAWHSYYLLSSTVYNTYFKTHVVPQGSAYLYLHGADGAPRDQALFTVPLTYLNPTLARETLKLIMGLTYADKRKISYAFAGYGYLSGAIVHENPSDLDIFFLLALTEYIAATGDVKFFNEDVPFYPHGAQPSPLGTKVIDHVRVAVNHLMNDVNLGENGLIRLSDGDWSDGVVLENVFAHPFQVSFENTVKHGESVPNSQMACYVLPRAANVIEPHDKELAEKMREWLPKLEAAVRERWTGKWYMRAVLRTHQNKPYMLYDKQIDLEAQPWALISDIAENQKTEAELVKWVDMLLDRPSPVGAAMLQHGMIWPAISQLLTWGYTRNHPYLAWRSFTRHTFARHAQTFPEVWINIWSGPDGTNGKKSSNPGGTWASPVTPMTDFPVMNNNQHAMALFALLRVCGIEPTSAGDGLRIKPQMPKQYALDMPLLKLDVEPKRVSGEYRAFVTGERMLYVCVPEDAKDVTASVGGQAVDATIKDGMVALKLTFNKGDEIAFEVAWS